MSTAVAFKSPSPFPFNINTVTLPPVGTDFITLDTSVDDPPGEPGFVEAQKIWWKLEQFTITASGSAGGDLAFSHQTHLIDHDLTLLIDGNTGGAAVDSEGNTIAPRYRIYQYNDCTLGHTYQKWFIENTDSGNELTESGGFVLYIAKVSGEWRLYYFFYFELELVPGSASYRSMVICNTSTTPVVSPGFPVGYILKNTGTFTIGGYTFGWSRYDDDVGSYPSSTGSLSGNWSFYTIA